MRIAGDGHATHLEALAWAAARTGTGPILELGVGWYSTPVLHGIAQAQDRELISVEANEAYRRWASDRWATLFHRIVAPGPDGLHPEVDLEELIRYRAPLVFVDHGIGWRRQESVKRYRGVASLIVVHDTEPAARSQYPGLAEELASFPWRREFGRLEPATTVVRP